MSARPSTAASRRPWATAESDSAAVAKPSRSRARRSARKSDPGRPPASHRPPQYNIYGEQLPPGRGSGLGMPQKTLTPNTLSGKVEVPHFWKGQPKHVTASQVRAARRAEFRPHPTFDLDGDGVVSPLDFFYATRFDKDKDGKLNAQERAAAEKALASGYADQFYVVSGPPAELMDHRVLQRRGKILKEEQGGFENLHETYSATELAGASKRRPFASDGGEFGLGVAPEAMKPASNGISTRKQLLATRRASMLKSLRAVGNEPAVASPKADKDTAARRSTAKSRSALFKQRREQALRIALDKTGVRPDLYDSGPFPNAARLSKHLGNSRSQVLRRRRRQFKKEAAMQAPTKPPGVHQKPLRSFAQNLNQTGGVWWQDKTHEQGVEPTPWHEEPEDRMVGRSRRNSKGQLRTTGSLKPTVAARDPFKERTLTADEVKRVRTRKYALADKITTKGGVVVPGTTVRSTQRSGEVHFTQKRWTDFVIEFKAVEERAKEMDPHEFDPMYSSFTRNMQFPEGAPEQQRAPEHDIRPTSSRRRPRTYGTPIALPATGLGATTAPNGQRPFSADDFMPGSVSPKGVRRYRSPGFEAPVATPGGSSVRPNTSGGYQRRVRMDELANSSGMPSRGRGGGGGGGSGGGGMVGSNSVPVLSMHERPGSYGGVGMMAPPSPAPALVGGDDALGGQLGAVGVRSGGFQRLLESKGLSQSASTPVF